MYKPFAASKKEEKKMTICTRNLSKKDSIVNSKKTSLSVSFWYRWLLCCKHNIMSSVAIFLEEENSIFFFFLSKIIACCFFPKLRWELPERVFPMSSLVRSCTCTMASLVMQGVKTPCGKPYILCNEERQSTGKPLQTIVEKKKVKLDWTQTVRIFNTKLFCPKQSEC